jgi:beta-ribofuranosylaminobenzene 5'-phosphate synthase
MNQPHVTVSCTARLHLGFLDLTGDGPRKFGSVGLSLDAPRTRLSLRSGVASVTGPEAARAEKLLQTLQAELGLSPAHSLTVHQAVPAHSGLGSGTQLALAVSAALRRLHNLPLDPRGDAQKLGRGARSGIGIATFEHGGLVVDGGFGPGGRPPPLLARLDVPEAWRVLLVLDPAETGFSGDREREGFAALAPMPAADSDRLCRLLLMQVLPAAAEDDLPRFGAALGRMQDILGDYFAPSQGGRFTSPLVAAAMAALRARGATGTGQSSWGPTGFGFVRGEVLAQRLAAELRPDWPGLDFMVCRARNRGAEVISGDAD